MKVLIMMCVFWAQVVPPVKAQPVKAPKSAPVKAPKSAPVVRLCAHVADRGATLACAFELTAKAARRRQHVFRFTEQDGRVLKMEVVNSAGFLYPETVGDPAILYNGSTEYRWSADGKTVWAIEYHTDGSIRERWKTVGLARDKYRPPTNGETDPEVGRVKGAGPCREKWTLDAKGFVKTLRFFNWKDEPRTNTDEFWGFEFERDKNGLVVAEYPLDRQGKRTKGPKGQVKYTISWDARGNFLGYGAVDEKGQPARARHYRVPRTTYDEVGNLTGERYFDTEGKPARSFRGMFGWKGVFDAAGNLVERTYLDAEGKPGTKEDDVAYGERFTVDARGQVVARCNLGADGKPAPDSEGVVCERRTLTDANRVSESRFVDAQGRLLARKDRVAIIRRKTSADGLREEEWFFDAADQPVLNGEGAHGEIFVSAPDGLRTEWCYHGLDKKKAANRHKVACNKTVYDQDGNITEEWYHDAAGKLVLNEDGIAGNIMKYDDFGRHVEDWYYGTKMELIVHPGLKYAGVVIKYDKDGEIENMTEYDAHRQPIRDPDLEDEPDGDGLTEKERFGFDPDQSGD